MMSSKRGVRYHTIKGVILPWSVVEDVLKVKAEHTLEEDHPEYPCGLDGGYVERKVYCKYPEQGSCCIHVTKHRNGMCIRPALTSEGDGLFAVFAKMLLDERVEKSRAEKEEG